MSKDLTKPTKAQVIERNRQLANELLSNRRKTTGQMRDDHSGRCCLQVAEDYAIKCGLEIERSDKSNGEPPEIVGDFFGWGLADPHLNTPNGKSFFASALNDGPENCWKNKRLEDKGLSHKRIAECFINTFVTPKKQKWSFTLELDEDAQEKNICSSHD